MTVKKYAFYPGCVARGGAPELYQSSLEKHLPATYFQIYPPESDLKYPQTSP